MAAFMLLGAKLGDILGRNRAFAIGLAIYGVGSLTTALSPSLAVLLAGWSGVEGFGAVLVVPAIAALTAATYEGRDRALAYALLGGIAAIAVAAGPLIGGWVTTEFSWRYVFAAETVVVILILLLRGQIARAPGAERRPRLDIVGVVLSSAGLGLSVFAILRSSVWGFVQPRTPPEIGGTEITPHCCGRLSSGSSVAPAWRPGSRGETLVARAEQGIDIVPVASVEQAVVKAGLTPDQARAVADDYGDAQLDALRLSLGAVALAALLSLWLTRRLPAKSLAESEVAATESA
jgi:MFS family permease